MGQWKRREGSAADDFFRGMIAGIGLSGGVVLFAILFYAAVSCYVEKHPELIAQKTHLRFPSVEESFALRTRVEKLTSNPFADLKDSAFDLCEGDYHLQLLVNVADDVSVYVMAFPPPPIQKTLCRFGYEGGRWTLHRHTAAATVLVDIVDVFERVLNDTRVRDTIAA